MAATVSNRVHGIGLQIHVMGTNVTTRPAEQDRMQLADQR